MDWLIKKTFGSIKKLKKKVEKYLPIKKLFNLVRNYKKN